MTQIRQHGRKKVLKKFAIFCLGVFLNYAGYLVLLNLQSSINIEEGIGTASITATYATSAIFGVLFTPICLRKLGPKVCLILCEFTYLVYILANAYAVAYTLIPAGVLAGIGEATMWPVMTLFVVHYAKRFSLYAKKPTESYMTQFIGIFYCLFHLSGAFGNILSYAIFYGGGAISKSESDDSTTAFTPVFRDLSICGKNDCQDPNITAQNKDRYEPASQTLIYVLVGVMGGLVIIAMLIHQFLVKRIDSNLEKEASLKEIEAKKVEEVAEEEELEEKKGSVWKFMVLTVKDTLLHMINPKQLLLTPFALYSGLLLTFAFSELTRAFGSCMLGVEQVGLLAALATTADAISSYSSCKLASWVGREVPMAIGFCLDIANYMICLFWTPTESSLWVVYVIFIMVGLIDGVWQPLINEIHAAYFPHNQDIAITIWNMYTLVGIAWQTGWSTSVCVYLKIYIQIGILVFSVFCYAIARRMNNNELKRLTQPEQIIFKTTL